MLIGSLQGDARPLRQVMTEFGAKRPKGVLILIGPEGDFTPAEIALALGRGIRPVTLGASTLRTETAALAAVFTAHIAHELNALPVPATN